MKYIYGLKELPEDKYGFAGGKASSLSRMMRDLKVRIPEGYVILSEAFGGSILKEDAAIVAREFGIPAVVGCGNATTVLKTGDIVTVDGSEGTVIQNTFPQIPL